MTAIDEEYMIDFDRELDAAGLECPLPILRTKKALTPMSCGEVLHVIATDPGSVRDFKLFCKHTGHELLENHEDDGRFYFLIKKS